ncbi:avidin/streptavidin family protein [Bradyrhizobium sp. SBR1B]|uniref:avidin/streptavidin family protein n=1 Tax=Bradyrhizobium sp. SBR1B TaxID=2663836 RepID=UPI00289DCA7E|nr:avidin/streptavidin family protein [Bradyrhizobium sp. SBR1B]
MAANVTSTCSKFVMRVATFANFCWGCDMMRLLGFLLLAYSFFLSAEATAQGLPAPSYWKNERGSELFVWSANGGAIQATFTNHAQGFACQGIPYPASGAASQTGLYFVVTFAQCNSFTRWIGTVKGSVMPTSWTLFYVDKNGKPLKTKGTDTFTRVW